MLRLCISLLVGTLALQSADTLFDKKRMQQDLMQTAFIQRPTYIKAFQEYAFGATGAGKDCCSWKVSECTDGIITGVILTSFKRHIFALRVERLPPTVQFVHVAASQCMVRFPFRCLPRDLRYIYVESTTGQVIWTNDETRDVLETADLPSKIEEVCLNLGISMYRTLSLARVPSTLRLFFIANGNAIQRVIVENRELGSRLDAVKVFHTRPKDVKIVSTTGEQADERVVAVNAMQLAEFTCYLEYDKKCKEWW